MEIIEDDPRMFYQLLLSALHQPTVDAVAELEAAWKLQRPKFISLLQHAPKSITDRQKVQGASSAPGIRLAEAFPTSMTSGCPRQGYVVLEQQYVDEALILSDVFELNEVEALKLVVAGQRETANHPDWPRGLCAVYLFYKNRWYQAQTVKMLMRNRQGRYWRHDVPNSGANEGLVLLQALVQNIADQLWNDNLLASLLSLLQSPADAVQAEFEKLQQPSVKGVGGPSHRSALAACIRETYAALGDSLYYWCCQTPLDQREFSSLMRFAGENAGKSASLPIILSILQAIDVNILETSDSNDEIAKYAPFTSDLTVLLAYNTKIMGSSNGRKWADPGAQSVVQLAWAVSLRMIAQHHLTQAILEEEEWTQDEEEVLNNALQLSSLDLSLYRKDSDGRGPFHWLRRCILACSEFLADELYQRRLHALITEMIICFPLKMKEWRSEADEECRHISESTVSGVALTAPPPLHFEQLMLMIGEFYSAPSTARLGLSEAYFCPIAQGPGTPSRRIPQSQVALFKFLRTSGEMLPSRLYLSYLRMLSGLASNSLSARLCFDMLKSFSTYGPSLNAVSIDNFFSALDRYLRVMRNSQQSSAGAASTSPLILPDEMRGLQAWFDLVATLAEQDDSVRLALFEDSRWSCVANVLGLLTCAVPLELKGHALRCLEAMARSSELALALSEGLLISGIVGPMSDGKIGGVQQELEEVESRVETYPVTTGLVKFLAALCQHKTFVPDGQAMTPYVNFVMNAVLVHLMNRNYKAPNELWDVAAAVFRFLYNIIDNYDPTVASVVQQSLGCQVMASIMNDGPVFRTICRICIASVQWLDEYKDGTDVDKSVREASLYSLKLFYATLAKQDAFNIAVIESGVPLLTTSMDILLQMLNPHTGESDYVVNLAMFLTHYTRLPEHCLYAVRIIDALNASSTTQTKIVKYFLANKANASRIQRGFVDCLSLDNVDATFDFSDTERETTSESRMRAHTALAVLELLIFDVKRGGGTGLLSNFLTGFDVRRPNETKLENPGVAGNSRTCLHAALDITEAALGQQLDTLSFGVLVEPAYRLLYWLAASPYTGEPTLRYLRTEYDFVRQHIQLLKLPETKQTDETQIKTSEAAFAIREVLGWLLKLCALELAVVAASQPSYVVALSKLLLTADNDGGYAASDVDSLMSLSVSNFAASSRRKVGRERQLRRSRRLFALLTTLKALMTKDLEESVVVPRLQHFEGVRLSKVVAACTVKTAKGYFKCDVARLYDVLQQELVALQGTTVIGQLHLVRNEIQNVVETLIRYNEIQYSVYVLRHGFAGFVQTAQLLFSACPLDWLESDQCDQAIIETMIEALQSNITVAANETADLLLSLTTVLRRRCNTDAPLEERPYDTTAASISSKRVGGLLDGSLSKSAKAHSLSCAGILATAMKLLAEAILKPENRRSDVRTSLYGALMNFFRLWQKPTEASLAGTEGADVAPFEPTVRERMAEEHWAILSRYVGDLVEVLAKDAAAGSEVTKTVAMCCLVTLLEQDALHGGPGKKVFLSRGYMNAIRFPPPFQKWVTILTS